MPAPKRTLNSTPKTPTQARPRTTPTSSAHGLLSGPGQITTVAERLGDERFAAAQRQTLATQTGQLVGNHTFTRLLGSQGRPAIQRNVGILGAMALTNVLAVKSAVQPTIAAHEPLSALDAEIDALGAKSRKKSYFHEEIGAGRDELVEGLGSLRGRVAETVVADQLGINEGLANAIRQHFYLKLSRLAPYYTQQANANILAISTTEAKMRTCNLTTVAMTLEGLGKTATDFKGNDELMNNIVRRLSLETKIANALRLPDFLQILAIYLAMTRKQNASSLNALATSNLEQFQMVMVEGAKEAANDILSSELFHTFTSKFSVPARSHTLDLNPALAVFGAYYRPFEKDLETYVREKKNKPRKAPVSEKEKEAFRDEFTEKRKANARQSGRRKGDKIEQADAALVGMETDITATKTALAETNEKLATLQAELSALETQSNQTGGEGQTTANTVKAKNKEHKLMTKKRDRLQNDLNKLEEDKMAQLTEKAKLQLAQGAYEAVGGEMEAEAAAVEETLPLTTYQNAVIPLMNELLGSGKQVIVNLHNHFVKLQAISLENIIVHDPGGIERDNKTVSWEDARTLGYFKRYTVVG